ncbi:MAG: divalent-cation tolerance protein CutA [Planctomycetota bacterium]|nr:MAG: divalent-cation tolerance protein CutA [Planctomycetota bacterium]
MSIQILLITAPIEKGKDISHQLLEKRLVACVNIISEITSLYWWEGKIEEGKEALLVCKTTSEKIGEILQVLPSIHPYEVPEVLAVNIDKGFPAYLEWVQKEVGEHQTD